MPPQNPLTRITEVAVGLRMLADDLERSDIDPVNLRHWAGELESARSDLERETPPDLRRASLRRAQLEGIFRLTDTRKSLDEGC